MRRRQRHRRPRDGVLHDQLHQRLLEQQHARRQQQRFRLTDDDDGERERRRRCVCHRIVEERGSAGRQLEQALRRHRALVALFVVAALS